MKWLLRGEQFDYHLIVLIFVNIIRGDHIVPNFEEIWPSNKDKSAKYKRRLIGMEYYLDAMEHHGLKGHLPQPENFTTCGKLGIEINQYNCPIEVITCQQ